MNTILHVLFDDNPGLTGELSEFCRSIPEFTRTEQSLAASLDQTKGLLAPGQFSALEDAVLSHLSAQGRACYLFGLGLRGEVLRALGAG